MKLFVIVFVVVLFTCLLYFDTAYSSQYEGFTPNIRGIYRPYIRNMRLFIKNFYMKTVNTLKKYGVV